MHFLPWGSQGIKCDHSHKAQYTTSKITNENSENFLSLKVLVPIQLMPEKSSLFQIALVAWVSGNANKAWLDD